jgi:hypothetical protein
LLQRLDLVHERFALDPGPVQQLVTQFFSELQIAIGHDDCAQPGIADVGVREPGKEARRQCAFRAHGRAAVLQFLVRMVIGALPHDMRQHWHIAPRHDRLHLAADRAQQNLAGEPSSLVRVDMRIGAVAGHDRRIRDNLVIEVGVHIERDGDRRLRIDRAQPFQELPLAVLEALGDHRAVQIEHDAVEPAARDRLANRVGNVHIGIVLHGAAGRCPGSDRQYDLRTLTGSQIEIGPETGAGAAKGADRRIAIERPRTVTEPRQRRRYR